jgi:hypothetical protein
MWCRGFLFWFFFMESGMTSCEFAILIWFWINFGCEMIQFRTQSIYAHFFTRFCIIKRMFHYLGGPELNQILIWIFFCVIFVIIHYVSMQIFYKGSETFSRRVTGICYKVYGTLHRFCFLKFLIAKRVRFKRCKRWFWMFSLNYA